MAMYLTKFSHTPDTWARLLANPEDRRTVLSPVIEAMGGKLHGYWYAFGDADGFVLFEAPDDVAAGSLLVKVASTGAFTNVRPPSWSRSKRRLRSCAVAAGLSTGLRARPAANGARESSTRSERGWLTREIRRGRHRSGSSGCTIKLELRGVSPAGWGWSGCGEWLARTRRRQQAGPSRPGDGRPVAAQPAGRRG